MGQNVSIEPNSLHLVKFKKLGFTAPLIQHNRTKLEIFTLVVFRKGILERETHRIKSMALHN